jgi:hypothetical protein
MDFVIHVEDMYNFNPGQSDIATGIPDSDNGRFEVTGLGRQYLNYSQLKRQVSWQGTDIANMVMTQDDTGRERKPQDNRRARNRV